MSNKGRWIKLLGTATVVAAALAGGISASRVFFAPGVEKLLSKAEAAYAKGVDALDQGDTTTAAIRFEEANLQANKLLDAIAKEGQQASEETTARLDPIEGKALWLKARALRDLFVAKGIAEGRPLPQTIDTLSGAKFYAILAIPNDAARQEAFTCLREAARRLSRDPAVQRQALLTELMLSAPDWNILEKIAHQLRQINAEEPWALYLLARIDFEQPNNTGRRSRTRVLQARQYVKQLKASGNYPLWRTLFLEAQIAQWLRDDAAPNNSKRRESEEQTLRSLLFAPKGALARAANGEGLEHPGKWDIEGLLGLHLLALTLAVEDSLLPAGPTRKTPDAVSQVVELLHATLTRCRQLADQGPPYSAVCALSAVQALAKAGSAFWEESPSDWEQDLNLAQELVRKAREQKVSNPVLYETLASLLVREAYLAGKRANKERQAEWNKQALQWLEDGLRLAGEALVPAGQLVELHAKAAEIMTLAGAKLEKVRVHLNALNESKSSRACALAALLEASIAYRDGRLVQARKLAEQVLASGEADLVSRAHMVLGAVYSALGQPDKALASLQQVAQAYKVYDRLTLQEKTWALEFIRGPEDLALLLMNAHADSALAQLRAAAHRYPDKPVSLSLAHGHENAIVNLRKQFRKQTPQDRQARQLLVTYYAATGRRERAEQELTQLRTLYPHSVDVLRTEVHLFWPARDAEKRIDQFIQDHPADLDARFFKVEWLVRMKRIDEALAYLQAPAHFADTKSERYQRVLAAVLLIKGDRQGSQKVLEHLPHDVATDALLIQAASADERERQVRQALARHADSALIQSWQAVLAFHKCDYAVAAEGFLRVCQYNPYEAAGRRGLLQSFLALAQSDPVKARDLAARLHNDAPEEPALLLASAYAYLQLDEIGTPGDKPAPVTSMAAALNAWEQMVLNQQPQAKASALLTKSAFWALAGRQDLALTEAVRALNLSPRNPAALELAVNLALELRDPDLRPVTRKRLDTLRRLLPNNTKVRLLEARFNEWDDQANNALAIYEDLLRNDAKLSAAYKGSISLLLKRGDKDKAWQLVKRWRKEQPDSIAAAQAEVRLLAEDNKLQQARKLAEATVHSHAEPGREGEDRAALDLSLQMVAALAQGKAWREAENWLKQLLDKNPDDVALLLQLGEVYLAQSSWDKARAVYEKVLAKSKNAVAANNLAWLLARHFNNAAEALRLVQEARQGRFSHKPISADRLRPEFLDTLGMVYTKVGEAALYPEMRDVFEAARQRYPHDPRTYMYLGHAYAGLQEREQAEHLYAWAVEVARKSGRQFLSPEQCRDVIAEVQAAQKQLRETAPLRPDGRVK
jgi:Flp pilus assembly protein TadD